MKTIADLLAVCDDFNKKRWVNSQDFEDWAEVFNTTVVRALLEEIAANRAFCDYAVYEPEALNKLLEEFDTARSKVDALLSGDGE